MKNSPKCHILYVKRPKLNYFSAQKTFSEQIFWKIIFFYLLLQNISKY